MKKVKAAFRGIVIFLLCVIEIYPLFWMLTASFKKQAEWSEKPAYALNDGFYFQNYSDAWTRGHMSTFFKNSLITTLVALVFIVFFSVTVGFAVTKMKWKFRNAVAQYFRFGIMIPVAIALIPLFQIYSKTNMLNTRTCLIITYIAFGLSLSIYNHQAIAFQIGEAHPTYIGLVAVFLWTVVGEVLFGHATFVQTHEGRTVAVAIVLVRTST